MQHQPGRSDQQHSSMTPLTYAVPPDTNRWGYTLTYHPPQPDRGAVQAAHHTPNQQPPGAYQQPAQPTNTQQAGMAQQHQQNGPSTGQQPGGPPTTDPQHQQPQAERPPPRHDRQPQQPHQAPPTQETEPTQCLQARANNNNNQQDTTPEATNPRGCSAGQGDPEQEAAAEPRHAPQLPQQRQEDEPTCNRNPQPPSTAKQPEQPIRNRWGRYLQPLSPHASPPEQATTTETGEATDPEAPPDTGSTPPTDAQPTTAEQGNQGYARMGHPGHQPLQRTTSKHEPTSGEVQQAADDSDTQQLHIPQEVDTQTAGHHPQQPQQHNRGGTEAAASSSGDQYQAPELEEVGDKPSSSGQASQPKPYHEGRGDQRMRGKRFKAAVQTAFGQRGWTKSDSETWKGVAHLVGMSEEDEEEEWAKIISRGPPPGGWQPRPDAPHPPERSRSSGGGNTEWKAILALHGKPRGAVPPEELQRIQRGHEHSGPNPKGSQQAAAGGPTGDPRRRRASNPAQPQPTQHRKPPGTATDSNGKTAGGPTQTQTGSSNNTTAATRRRRRRRELAVGRSFQQHADLAGGSPQADHLPARDPHGLGSGCPLQKPAAWSVGRRCHGDGLAPSPSVQRSAPWLLQSKTTKATEWGGTCRLYGDLHGVRPLPMGACDKWKACQMAAPHNERPIATRRERCRDDSRIFFHVGMETRGHHLGVRGATPEDRTTILL